MKFLKNEDGTMNLLPVVIIVTALCGVCFYFVFSSLTKTNSTTPTFDDRTVTTRSTEKTTIQLCNDCSMSFTQESYDVSTNGTIDLETLVKLDKVGINFVKFSVTDESLATIKPKNGTFMLNTGNNAGTVTLKAEYSTLTSVATLNVVNPTNTSISFKYPYYVIKKGGYVDPEIVTYPLGLKINDAKYNCNEMPDNPIGVDEGSGRISGNNVGENIANITKDGMKASTKVYVVENYITIKVKNGNQYKAIREYYPSNNIFDILVVLDNNKNDYTDKDLSVYKVDGSLDVSAAYVSKGSEVNSYVYHVEAPGSGEATLKVQLSDGSFNFLVIKK